MLYRHAALSRDPSARLWRRLWRGGGLCLPFTSGAGLAPRAPPPTPAPACSGRAIVPALDPASGDLAGAAARDETHASRDPQLTQLHAQSAEVAEAIDLAQDFVTLVRQLQPPQLDLWLRRGT